MAKKRRIKANLHHPEVSQILFRLSGWEILENAKEI